ncbi:MAG: bifunctional 4-hydroxy-2-oxoglutarate aldolase/2-dehydro-3-deoxy-phosphogluconate aldolase [Elusimicrobiota bacterium]|jgi:2-dehydro-3-deoxyphosphogluconate aldolase/(4S)-4-hydroxy-2-oxoglutarate aldolase|nr:bifunctional 4-hydroxy-2-oxoglutarate aldolase/2-dehydro-3-deoxy-phosphogluconate aldolase [Elusimicrobiota bacterium]
MNELIQKIYQIGIVPVVVFTDIKQVLPAARALLEGGIDCAEITFRTNTAEEAIKIISNELPQMLVGAGTVLTTDQVDKAQKAGAKFIVSPGTNPKILKHCVDKNITVIAGCSNPSDIEICLEYGIDTVKFFPAEAAGGINMVKAMSAPYTNVKFMPTGGIDIKNLNSYLSFNKVIACGGSWMINKNLLEKEDYQTVKQLSKEAVSTMLGFEFKHMGINSTDVSETEKTAQIFSNLFDFAKRQTSVSIFTADYLEIMKPPWRGSKGHIAIAANNVDRAVYYLSKKSVKFDEDSAKYDIEKKLTSIYLEGEIGGFAIHLCKK